MILKCILTKRRLFIGAKEIAREKRVIYLLGIYISTKTSNLKEDRRIFTSFLPAISKEKLKEIRPEIRKDNLRARTDLSLEQIAEWYNPKIRGWYNYFGKFYPSILNKLWKYFNKTLMLWAKSKYKNIRTSKRKRWILNKKYKMKYKVYSFTGN